MNYVYKAVERIPRQLDEGVVYHSEKFELGALLCACGCGHRVDLLVPDSHRITSNNGFANIHPSISVLDAACKSHYCVTAGGVLWLASFSGEQAREVMQRQIARHVEADMRHTWRDWLRDRGRRAIRWVLHLLGR
jgi:hypothetical protein